MTADVTQEANAAASPPTLCEYCVLTTIIPPLSSPRNLLRWQRLELAKRQLHIQLRSLGLPPYAFATDAAGPPLTYEFVEASAGGPGERPMIGHEAGRITMLAEEADDSYREQQRECLNEPQRTLIGHFRHEIGHYIDLVGVPAARRSEYIALFGDPDATPYEAAKTAYYAAAPGVWQERFVSQYASMHPWEDFAETVDAFLNLAAVMQVAGYYDLVHINSVSDLAGGEGLKHYRDLALMGNELNFSRGLNLLIPEIITEAVQEKLAFVASLCRSGSSDAGHAAN